jgi:uncharacterized protein (DUF885 family)
MSYFGFFFGGDMIRLLALFIFISSCTHTSKDVAAETQKFNAFLDQTFDEFLNESPEGLSYFGKKEKYDKLDDRTEAFELKMHELTKKRLADLKKFHRRNLDEQAQLSFDLFKSDLEQNVRDFEWRDYNYAVNQQSGVHTDLPTFMINMHKVDNEKDLQDYIARLKEFKRVFAEVGEQIRRSEKKGIVPPKFVFPSIYSSAKNVIQGAPFEKSKVKSPLWLDFQTKLSKLKLTTEKRKLYSQQAEDALKNSVAPAYADLIAVVQDLEKRANNDDGAWKFPRGEEFYNIRLQRFTTTSMTANEIHELGLKNVARLRSDMEAVKNKLGFKGTLPEFFKFVRGDKKQYYPDTTAGHKAYLAVSEKYLSDIQRKIPNYFRLVPKASMVIKPVEKFRETGAGKAFYQQPSDDGTRPGTYYVNLRDMKDAPKFEAEALFYHEGIPGHHFQIALAMELKNLPKYRRYNGYTAFVEGWALYTERLAKEMGGYKDDYAELGRLSMEMIRACRLVVDTGIHSKKWTREQAIDFMGQNLPVSAGMQTEQIERYIIWPGQATAYMVGMLKIVELREKAQKELGNQFDIRDFHDVVLGNGAVSLAVLEQLVDQYIQQKKS